MDKEFAAVGRRFNLGKRGHLPRDVFECPTTIFCIELDRRPIYVGEVGAPTVTTEFFGLCAITAEQYRDDETNRAAICGSFLLQALHRLPLRQAPAALEVLGHQDGDHAYASAQPLGELGRILYAWGGSQSLVPIG
jgi:hypothetical protein